MAPKIREEIGLKIIERPVSIHEIVSAAREERLVEVLGVSSPSFVQPIGKIVYKD
jgi:hypothetical protein